VASPAERPKIIFWSDEKFRLDAKRKNIGGKGHAAVKK
jgi:hypothetical protein